MAFFHIAIKLHYMNFLLCNKIALDCYFNIFTHQKPKVSTDTFDILEKKGRKTMRI